MAVRVLLTAGPALVGMGLLLIRVAGSAGGQALVLAGLGLLTTGILMNRRPG